LLGYDSASELAGPFERVFQEAVTAQRIFATNGPTPIEVDLVRKDKSTVPVLISGTCLPKDLFRKVFVCKALTVARRLEKLESLGTLFQDVALQSHTPLALVDTWVRHRARENPDDDLYAKILPQLRKIEITYDRLALSMDGGTLFQTTDPQP